jgi:YHS domain-containing protein
MELDLQMVPSYRNSTWNKKSGWMVIVFFALTGCGVESRKPDVDRLPGGPVSQGSPPKLASETATDGHEHKPGAHGGLIVSLGRDSYHVEAVFDKQGLVRLFTLGQDETRVIDIEAKELSGFVRLEGDAEAQSLKFLPEPQDGDGEGRSSLFVAKLPESMVGQMVEITIPNVAIDGERFRLAFTKADLKHGDKSHGDVSMPQKVADDQEQKLYLEPGGHYTAADIAANGNVTPYQKYRGIPSTHDMSPKPGDRICPITETKANPKFVWVIGGKSYQFCCPPCIDEFLQKAKSSDDPLPDPEIFVQSEPKP